MKLRIFTTLMVLAVLLSACAAPAPEKETVVETVVIEKEGETLIVTATPEPKELAGLDPDQRAWLEAAQLGPFTPATQDWDAIEAAAREEGEVVIYSVSSRIFKLQDEFKEKYGVDIIGFDLASDVALEKLRREHNAGIYEADVIFSNESSLMLNEFVPQGMVWNFVPESLVPFLEPYEMEPLLTQRWSSRVVIYNTFFNPEGAPIDNLWDFTREEWNGKMLMPDPLEGSVQANAIQTILQHPDEMAAAYELEFGEPLTEYSEDLVEIFEEDIGGLLGGEPNAAMEWLYQMLQNDPVFLGSTTKIGNNVGDVNQDDPPVGMTTFSKLRKVEEGVYEWAPAYDLQPVFGVSYPTVLVVADRAPHPNAAKLLIRYMMEDGYWPWNEPGDYAGRSDFVAQQVIDFGIPSFEEANMWPIDQSYVYDTKYVFLNLYLELK
ncbi:MAG: ABC transporter substrate-binding protein [Anaerolineales bacterium]|nr:ABC transporter substrate-binding protein [Anaerolineales bacterium]